MASKRERILTPLSIVSLLVLRNRDLSRSSQMRWNKRPIYTRPYSFRSFPRKSLALQLVLVAWCLGGARRQHRVHHQDTKTPGIAELSMRVIPQDGGIGQEGSCLSFNQGDRGHGDFTEKT